jgi:hypothetical protein
MKVRENHSQYGDRKFVVCGSVCCFALQCDLYIGITTPYCSIRNLAPLHTHSMTDSKGESLVHVSQL